MLMMYLCTESKLGCEEGATAVTSNNCPQWWTVWQSSLPLQTGQSYLSPFNLPLVHTYWSNYFSFCLWTGVLFSFIFFLCVWMCPKSKENWTGGRGDVDCEFIWLVIFVLIKTVSLFTFLWCHFLIFSLQGENIGVEWCDFWMSICNNNNSGGNL